MMERLQCGVQNIRRNGFPWKPPKDLPNIIDIAAHNSSGIALAEDGRLFQWSISTKEVPETNGKRIVKISGNSYHTLALTDQGTVIVINRGKEKVVEEVPPGLTDVVDIIGGPGISLALRADGTWVGWGSNKDGFLTQLDKVKGVRRLACGGSVAEGRFLVGIQIDPSELRSR